MNDPLKRITVDPAICHGKPTVRGLRYPVSMILELLAGNMTPKEILADYPDLERKDISACLGLCRPIEGTSCSWVRGTTLASSAPVA